MYTLVPEKILAKYPDYAKHAARYCNKHEKAWLAASEATEKCPLCAGVRPTDRIHYEHEPADQTAAIHGKVTDEQMAAARKRGGEQAQANRRKAKRQKQRCEECDAVLRSGNIGRGTCDRCNQGKPPVPGDAPAVSPSGIGRKPGVAHRQDVYLTRLREMRVKAGLSQDQLTEKLGLKPRCGTVGDNERLVHRAKKPRALEYARILGCTYEELGPQVQRREKE